MIADLSNHRIYNVIKSKFSNLVERRLITYKDREKVTMVCMDLSSSDRSIVRKCFPNARIVADCFHVIGMISHHFMGFCEQAQESIRWNRPIIRTLRKRSCNLTARERQTLQELFELNPAIGVCHEFKEKLGDLLRLKSQTVNNSKEIFKNSRK